MLLPNAEPLSLIYDRSFAAGLVPSDWKIADIGPIFKKGAKDDPTNYRPVSLTSVPCKVMESIIKDSLKTFLSQERKQSVIINMGLQMAVLSYESSGIS